MTLWKNLVVALVAAFALAACSSSSDTAGGGEPPAGLSAYEMAVAAIAAADTDAAAQAAVDDAAADVSGAELRDLQVAANARKAALETAASAAQQKMALMDAAGMIDTSDLATAEDIAAAAAAIAALKAAIAAAVDVADTSMYQSQVDAAEAAVMTAQSALDTEGRMMVQRSAISDAVAVARTAVGAVNDDSADADLMAADDAIAALRAAIVGAADLPEGDATVASGQGTLDTLVTQLDSAKTSRQMAMDEAAAEQRQASIDTAQSVLTTAQSAVAALAGDATDEEKRDAQRMVEAAANALRDVLQMNGGSTADIEAAIRAAQTAKVAADALQATITARAEAEDRMKMQAIATAQTALTMAEDARDMLADDATDKEKRAAHRAVQMAANTLIQVLEDNDGTAGQITAATMTRDSAMGMADALTSPIEIADQRKAITDALATLRAAVAKVDDDATDAEVKAADDAVAAARKAIADATELPEEETMAHGEVVTAHEGILNPAKESRQTALDAEAEKVAEMAREASNKIALTKKAEIEAEGDATTTARPFDLADAPDDPTAPTANENYVLTVKHTGSAVEATVLDGHGDFDQKNDPKFSRAASFGNGQMLVRNDGTEREIIVLHTDVDAPDNVRFGRSNSGYSLTVDVDTDTSAYDSYLVNADEDGSKLGGSRIVSADPGSKVLAQWGGVNDNKRDAAVNVFRGTLDGAPGSFRCQVETCTITTTAGTAPGDDNTVTVNGALWFTPDAGATVEIADDEYLTWGFWLKTTTKDGAIASYDTVQTFAMASSGLPVTTGDLDAIEGTATYVGGAAGVYVHETKKEDGQLDTATSGRFTADVALTADFDGSTTRVANTVAGRSRTSTSTAGRTSRGRWTWPLG